MLARRRRAGDIDLEYEAVVLQAFTEDVRQGVIAVYPVEDHHLVDAEALLGRLQRHPLRTLDAIHLAIASALKMEVLATADRVMTDAARDLGLNVVTFF